MVSPSSSPASILEYEPFWRLPLAETKVPPPVGLPLTNSPLKHEPSGKIHSPELIAPSFQLPASSLGPVYLAVPALASDFHSPV